MERLGRSLSFVSGLHSGCGAGAVRRLNLRHLIQHQARGGASIPGYVTPEQSTETTPGTRHETPLDDFGRSWGLRAASDSDTTFVDRKADLVGRKREGAAPEILWRSARISASARGVTDEIRATDDPDKVFGARPGVG
jgi:hypothetical protein